MQGDIIDQGLELMLYGMGTVVVFLTLLILATSFMSWFLGRFFPEAETPTIVAGSGAVAGPQATGQARLLAVITAAVHQHRKNK